MGNITKDVCVTFRHIVSWPDYTFGPINLWTVSPAWWFNMTMKEKIKMIDDHNIEYNDEIDEATRDQIAMVMALRGTPDQEQEAREYIRSNCCIEYSDDKMLNKDLGIYDVE